METVYSLIDLNIPSKYVKFLEHFLSNLSTVQSVDRVILFGSCARSDVHFRSDIDLMILGDGITEDEEVFINFDCCPTYPCDYYLPCDIFTLDHLSYNSWKSEIGSLYWRIEQDGKDLTNILR